MTLRSVASGSNLEQAIFESCDAIPVADWNTVCDLRANPYLDLRFLRAVEFSLKPETRFWYVLLYQNDGDASGSGTVAANSGAASSSHRKPVACAAFALYPVDGGIFAPPKLQSMINSVRRVWRSFFRFKVLLCGTPVSTGRNELAIAPDADVPAIVRALDDVACQLARRSGCWLISFKEFDPAGVAMLEPLRARGYRESGSVVSYTLDSTFHTFDDYYNSRSKRTRANIRRTFSKGEAAGLTVQSLHDGTTAAELFSDDCQRLYENVMQRAKVKFESLPIEFFRNLAREYGTDARFTYVRQGKKPVAFCCALKTPGRYNMLYCGVDYELNSTAEVYFNMMYRSLGFGFADDVQQLHVGASADEFKQHLGCRGTPLSVFIKAIGAIRSRLFGLAFPYLFDPPFTANVVAGSEKATSETAEPPPARE